MMITPQTYIEELKDADYFDLIAERDGLIASLQEFEKNEIAGDRSGFEWNMMPMPYVKYQMYLVYLSELCKLMHEEYNKDYVMGDRDLLEDYKRKNSKSREK